MCRNMTGGEYMNNLEEKMLKLSDDAKKEVDDFIDFLIFKYSHSRNVTVKKTISIFEL